MNEEIVTFRKGDPVWHEPRDPIKARDPRTAKVAGWLGTVNPATKQALFLRFNEIREEIGILVPLEDLRHRVLPGRS